MPDRKTVTMQRANVILEVSEDWVDRYLDQGYNVIDNRGNVIKSSIPRDLGTLQKAYVKNQKEIEENQKEIERLKAEVAKLSQKKTGRSKKTT